MPQISIVIPAYNASNTIESCISSILNQTFSDFEILAINDGSKDQTAKKIEQISFADERVHLINQENGGVSSARNKGISLATGKYIAFIDADDSIMPTYLDKLLETIDGNDMSICNYILRKKKNIKIKINQISGLGKYENAFEIIKRIIRVSDSIRGVVWRTLFKASIIKENNLLFDCNLSMSEDYKFLLEYLSYAKTVGLCKEYLYEYMENSSSALGKYMPNMDNSLKKANQWLSSYVKKFNDPVLDDYYKKTIANSVIEAYSNIKKIGSPYTRRDYNEYLDKNWLSNKEYAVALEYELGSIHISFSGIPRIMQIKSILRKAKNSKNVPD